MEVIAYEMQQKVKIRKFDVDCDSLCKCLRKHKEKYGFTNIQISQILNVSLTKVQHWFRNDKCFSIPDPYIWFDLKKLLQIKTDEFDKSIMTFQEKENVFEKSNRIYDSCGISPTITCSDSVVFLDRSNYMEVKIIGQMDNTIDNTFESANRVYDKNGISPTINTCGGGGLQPKVIDENIVIGGMQKHQAIKKDGICTTLTSSMGTGGGYVPMVLSDKSIVAMRGRNPDNPSDRTVGSPTEQRLEPNSQGICNTLTSVQKDNLVLEQNPIGSLYYGASEGFGCGYMDNCYKTVKAEKDDLGVVESVKIKQATKDGYVECKIGGVADLSFPSSTTRRGRVQDNGDTCPTLMAGEQDICRIEKEVEYEETISFEILRILRREIGEKDFSDWSIRGLWCVLQEEILRQNLYAKSIYENWTHRPELFKFAYNSKGNQYSIHSEKSMRNMWEEWTVRCTPQRQGLSEQQCREFDDFMSRLPYETTQRKEFVHCLWEASEGVGLLRQALSEVQEIWKPVDSQEVQRCFYRIRKLTPKCCWRLMDFTDEDFHKAEEVNSNTQLYKQAGNSIIRNVLVAIFGQMLDGKEDVYKEINSTHFSSQQQ